MTVRLLGVDARYLKRYTNETHAIGNSPSVMALRSGATVVHPFLSCSVTARRRGCGVYIDWAYMLTGQLRRPREYHVSLPNAANPRPRIVTRDPVVVQ